jgi:ligand-binding sensor domain-containing protein
VNGIVPLGDTLWCATNGGILLFDLNDSTFTQHMDGIGLRSSRIAAITVDENRSLWVGHISSGIDRIDHIDSEPFVKHYSAAVDLIQSDSITSIVAAGDDIYYGGSNGVAKFFDNLPSPETGLTKELEGTFVHDMLLVGDSLWIAYEDGAGLFERSSLQLTLYSIGGVYSLTRHEGRIWAATTGGVQRFVPDGDPAWEQVGAVAGVPLSISSGGGVLACVTASAAYRWDGSQWEDIAGNRDTPGSLKYVISRTYYIWTNYDIFSAIAVDARGTPWVGGIQEIGNRGAYLSGYIGGEWLNKAPTQLTQNEVVELGLDPQRGLWMSSLRYGVSYLSNGGTWSTYTKFRGDVGDDALSYFAYNLALLYDSQDNLWLNVLGADLDRIVVNDPLSKADDVWEHYGLAEGTLTSNRFVKAKEDPAGNRWFLSDDDAMENGIWGINIANAAGTEWLTVNPDSVPEMESGSVFDCAFGPDGRVYLALRGYGVQVWFPGYYDWDNLSDLDDDVWFTIIDPDQLTSTIIHSIALDEDGSVWLGTASGLVRYRSGVIDSLTKKIFTGQEGLVGAIVYDLEFDGGGNLWVATDGGLDKIDEDGEIVETYTTADYWSSGLEFLYPNSIISPLPSPICKALEYDEHENVLWIGTDNGLARLDMSPPSGEEIPLSQLILYPNPIYPSRGDDALQIWGISPPVSIRIFTVEGELVHRVVVTEEGGVAWDLLTLNGYLAQSGIYIVVVNSIDGRFSETRKIALIR